MKVAFKTRKNHMVYRKCLAILIDSYYAFLFHLIRLGLFK